MLDWYRSRAQIHAQNKDAHTRSEGTHSGYILFAFERIGVALDLFTISVSCHFFCTPRSDFCFWDSGILYLIRHNSRRHISNFPLFSRSFGFRIISISLGGNFQFLDTGIARNAQYNRCEHIIRHTAYCRL